MTTQTETTHTPGPWELCHRLAPDHAGDRVIYGPGKLPRFICDMDGGPNDDSETLANARLIAAAPELLKIARDYLDVIKACVGGEENQTVNEVQNIIFKAEGR